ncbi:hypothetical protein GYA49_00760 [Candidatus Beckwithbacteria bacterium]|nr:hypothetical protein [Candidatus Beckwithbacteria bacterium]
MKNKYTFQINTPFDFYLFAGSLYFCFYLLSSGKFIYLILSLVIYLLGRQYRKHTKKANKNPQFSETGIFLITPLFLAYLLILLGFETSITDYLPDKLITGSGLIFLMAIFLIPKLYIKNQRLLNLISLFLFIFTILLLIIYQNRINNLLLINPWIAKMIVGSPLVYLFTVITGIDFSKD